MTAILSALDLSIATRSSEACGESTKSFEELNWHDVLLRLLLPHHSASLIARFRLLDHRVQRHY